MASEKRPISREKATEIIKEVRARFESWADLIVAGSYRRKKKTVNDIDFVVVPKVHRKAFYQRCIDYLEAPLSGGKKENVKAQYLYKGAVLDFWIAEREKLGAMMLFLTGSAEFNIKTRRIAKGKGYFLNQYGLYELGTDNLVGDQSERGIIESLDLDYPEPERRQ